MSCDGILSGHANTADKVARNISPQHRLAIPAFIILLIGISFSLALIQVRQNLPMPNVVVVIEPPAFKQPETLNGLLTLSSAELEHRDISRMNLLCAEALPGAENLNMEECLATLDQTSQRLARAVRLVQPQQSMNPSIAPDAKPLQQAPRNTFQTP